MLTSLRSRSLVPGSLPQRRITAPNHFDKMPAVDLQQFLQMRTEKRFEKRQIIFRDEETASLIWFVHEGHVKEVHHLSGGRDKTLSLAGPNHLFGVSAFTGGPYGCDGVALTDAVLWSFPAEDFRVLVTRVPVLASVVLERFSDLVRQYKNKTRFAQESARCRLLYALTEMMAEFGTSIPLTRKEIGEMAGLRGETTIRVLGQVEKEGWMALSRGRITILEPSGLRKALFECGGERLDEIIG